MKVDSAFQYEWSGFWTFPGFCKKYAPFSINIRNGKQGKKPEAFAGTFQEKSSKD